MSLNEVFEYIFDLLARVVRYDSVSIQLLGEDQILFAAGRGFSDLRRAHKIIRESLLPYDRGALGTAVSTRHGYSRHHRRSPLVCAARQRTHPIVGRRGAARKRPLVRRTERRQFHGQHLR